MLKNQRPEFRAEIDLRSDRTYVWSVRTKNAAGITTPWATTPGRFTTGILAQEEWQAKWIRGGTQMRKDFKVAGSVARASIFVSACQYYELYVDGKRIGEQKLDVGWTSFKTNRSYATHDIAPSLLLAGDHTLGLRIGQGFCTKGSPLYDPHIGDDYDPNAERSALLQLQLHDAAGNVTAVVSTDNTWHVSDGPIVTDSTYFGETYDATREQPGWASPGGQCPSIRIDPDLYTHKY
jgi:alpha-L-rhamnosidase